MEVVSSLCFGQSEPPETDLVTEVLKLVITEGNETRNFTYSDKTDKIPVIRSFLLQLLMEHKYYDLYVIIGCLIFYIIIAHNLLEIY